MEKKYKKIVLLLGISMTLVFAMVFTGCGKKETANDTETIGTEVISTEEIGTEEISTEEIGTEEISTEEMDVEETDSSEENQTSESASKTEQSSASESKTETTTNNAAANNNTPVSGNQTENNGDTSTNDSSTTNDSNSESDAVTSATPESSETGFKTGTYRGGHKIEAMGGELPYTYSMDFKDDGTYFYQVSFVVGGETYSEEESGTYTVSGSSITMTSNAGVTTSGSYSDGKVTITRRVSTFASEDATITLQ